MNLTPEHINAVNRRRRIVVQYDAFAHLGADFDQWLDYRFDYIDDPDSQIDSIWWDIGGGTWATYPSKIIEPLAHPGLQSWRDQGIDWVRTLVEETRRRGLEAFWNHRISEVDIGSDAKLNMTSIASVKAAHPDWVIKTWWWQGMWNLANPELREWKLSVLRELAQNYEFDGFQIDFARHIPCLPVGRQWELRDNVTEFMRMVRQMTLEIEGQRGRPFLLAARIPKSLEGCRADGFDVVTWAQEGLVDILSLGSRSASPDVAGFREAIGDLPVKLQPCFDDHHATDGYQYSPIEYLRGVFGNWHQQGADSVMTFNWSNGGADKCRSIGGLPGPESQPLAYREIGDTATLAGKSKVFFIERRGGYPWAEGYFNQNNDAPLPVELRHDGTPSELTIRVCDDLRAAGESLGSVVLRLILFGARDGDEVAVALNGAALEPSLRDAEWKDKGIFSPAPQPASGGADHYKINPDQRLLRLEFAVPADLCGFPENQVSVGVVSREPYMLDHIKVEKIELHVTRVDR